MFSASAQRSAHPGAVHILKRRVGVLILVVLTILPLTVVNCSRNAQVASKVSLGLTPGSNVANFFSPFDIDGEEPDQALKAFVQVMAGQNYQVRAYVDKTGSDDDMPGGATALNFIQLIQGAGIIFFFTHGGLNNHLMMELYNTQAVRDQTYAAYTKGLIPSNYIETCYADRPTARPYIGGYGICLTPAGITQLLHEQERGHFRRRVRRLGHSHDSVVCGSTILRLQLLCQIQRSSDGFHHNISAHGWKAVLSRTEWPGQDR